MIIHTIPTKRPILDFGTRSPYLTNTNMAGNNFSVATTRLWLHRPLGTGVVLTLQ